MTDVFYLQKIKQIFPNKEIHHFGNVSAKLGANIEELFIFVAKLTLNMNINNNNLYNNTIKLDNSTVPNNNNNCSC